MNRLAYEQVIANDTLTSLKQSSPDITDFNFQDQHIVLIAMGEKPTAGYRLRIENETPTLEGDTLFLPIHYQVPEDDMQAHIVTSPCMVVSLDKGAYQVIRVREPAVSSLRVAHF